MKPHDWYVMIIGLLGVSPLACIADEHCTVVENERGAIEISCPDGTSSTVPSCYENLPDLDGSGAVDVQDCAWVGVGITMREVCSEPGEWLRHEECRALDVLLAPDIGYPEAWKTTNLGTVGRPQFAMATVALKVDGLEIRYSHDLDSNGILEEDEQTVVANRFLCGNQCSIIGLYRDFRFPGPPPVLVFEADGSQYLWRDDDRNDHTEDLEIRQLGDRKIRSAVPGTHFAAVGIGDTLEAQTAWLWIDQNGDYAISSSEIQTLASDVNDVSLTTVSDATLAAVYNVGGNTYVWRDSDGDSLIEDSEKSMLAESACGNAELFVHNGGSLYSCSSRDLTLHSTELESTWLAASPVRVGQVGNGEPPERVMAAFSSRDAEGRLWYDLNHDGAIADTEIVSLGPLSGEYYLRRGDPFLEFSTGTFLNYMLQERDGPTKMVNIHPPDETLFLNEPCAPAADRCAGTLACRASGYAEDPRCVPPESI